MPYLGTVYEMLSNCKWNLKFCIIRFMHQLHQYSNSVCQSWTYNLQLFWGPNLQIEYRGWWHRHIFEHYNELDRLSYIYYMNYWNFFKFEKLIETTNNLIVDRNVWCLMLCRLPKTDTDHRSRVKMWGALSCYGLPKWYLNYDRTADVYSNTPVTHLLEYTL